MCVQREVEGMKASRRYFRGALVVFAGVAIGLGAGLTYFRSTASTSRPAAATSTASPTSEVAAPPPTQASGPTATVVPSASTQLLGADGKSVVDACGVTVQVTTAQLSDAMNALEPAAPTVDPAVSAKIQAVRQSVIASYLSAHQGQASVGPADQAQVNKSIQQALSDQGMSVTPMEIVTKSSADSAAFTARVFASLVANFEKATGCTH